MDEKLWIINHRKENPKIKQNKIALDFSAKFKKTVCRACILSVEKLCYEMDQMYIEQEFEIEAEHQDLIIVGPTIAQKTSSPVLHNTIFQK